MGLPEAEGVLLGVVERWMHSHGLTLAEAQVLALLCLGCSGPAIASRRGTCLNTVHRQFGALSQKCGCSAHEAAIKVLHQALAAALTARIEPGPVSRLE